MTLQKIKEKQNDEYVHNFMKEVGTWLRRNNIRNTLFTKPKMSGEINFKGLSFKLYYTSYAFQLGFDDKGANMTLTGDNGKTLGFYQDFNKLKAAIVKYIKEAEQRKKSPGIPM